eukprot:TRINITY_DN1112_c0_g1_i1.p1 TRINITY_DN1112_c0_g1~~TRINITY_DN1112_c0_g1_i1.p1  ORF type:complete len:473 (-),score=108.95 TRINITY_DN1112_c0_g1_i1:738-2156(-)
MRPGPRRGKWNLRTILLLIGALGAVMFLYTLSAPSSSPPSNLKDDQTSWQKEKEKLQQDLLQATKEKETVQKVSFEMKEELRRMESLRKENADLKKEVLAKQQKIDELERRTPEPAHQNEPPSMEPAIPDKPTLQPQQIPKDDVVPLIIFTYNRPEYLNRTLHSLFQYAPENLKIYISQDGTVEEVDKLIESFPTVTHLKHSKRDPIRKVISQSEPDVYYFISQHYKFGLQKIFDEYKHDSVIILEDDMEISPDFFSYFKMGKKLLEDDKTLLCVSAWNDNGREALVKDSLQLYRSNFFPGLGWMMIRRMWEELGPKWPPAYWDDWLREPLQRQDRDCIRPEISRTYTFGSKGSSGGQFYEQYLAGIKLNRDDIDWSQQDVSYLTKELWDPYFNNIVESAKKNEVRSKAEVEGHKDSDLIIYYNGEHDFASRAAEFNLMQDFKAHVPRTAYNGVVIFRFATNTVLLAPHDIK